MAVSPSTLTRTQTGEIPGVRRSSTSKGSAGLSKRVREEPSEAALPDAVMPQPGGNMHVRRPGIEQEPLCTWSDVELLCGFREGNERAYAELYGRHKSEIYTYCLRMMSNDEDLASDAFQEIFIKVYEKADQF